MTGSDVADSDALLVLENLKVLNYTTGDRVAGFSKPKAMKILEVCFSARYFK